MKKLSTSLILTTIQSDFFNFQQIKDNDFLEQLKNLKQFIYILKNKKNLQICFISEEEETTIDFFFILKKYLKTKKKINVITTRKAYESKKPVIYLFICNKKVNKTLIFKASKNSQSISFVFNYEKNENTSSYHISKVLNNYKQLVYLISLINNLI